MQQKSNSVTHNSSIIKEQKTQTHNDIHLVSHNKKQTIQLRRIQLSDAPTVKQLMTTEICQTLSIAPITTINQAHDFILGKNSNQNIRLGISHRRYGLIGGISYCTQKNNLDQTVVLFSYWLGQQYQRQGYTFNALSQLFKQLENKGSTQFLAKVYPSNVPSQNLLKKLAFQYNEISSSKDPSVFVHFTRDIISA
ncbi:GNAT family N-acetyltransferase [Shewanella surugensis]|uniref:GNAT family N-acetyltransferase n=1 Tax=Shewanella surugensis TaxID=212020 RepID=A0ABT0LGE4_9GAMM|nr:GNAT family N-acetyltransferase [Shewanella surugensis]MCL1126555.1 GNAT family N-acetyltransferase [Shewanella surugensis]